MTTDSSAAHPATYSMGRGVKQLECKVHYLTSSFIEVKNVWSYTYIPTYFTNFEPSTNVFWICC